jgi:hypothetical protein
MITSDLGSARCVPKRAHLDTLVNVIEDVLAGK